MSELQSRSAKNADRSFDFKEFIDSHGDRLLRSAYLLCGNEVEAQDLVQETLVQETLVQALKSWTAFRGDSAAYVWLHGILLNLHRRHRRKQERLVYDDELIHTATFQADHAQEMDRDFCAITLTEAMQKLSPEHREVIVLRFYEGLKIEQIARQTGVSKGTVKSRLYYAVQRLERLIPPEMNLFASSGTQ